MAEGPSQYETDALRAIQAWKNSKRSWFGRALDVLNQPFERASALVVSAPGVDWAIRSSINIMIPILNNLARWSVRPKAVYKAFSKCGRAVEKPEDIAPLGLEEVDCALGLLGVKYRGVAAVEGGAIGLAGLPGIPADNAALIALNQRAITEYAAHCGFDAHSREERIFAMNILGLAANPSDSERKAAVARLDSIASDLAKMRTLQKMQQQALEQLVPRIAVALGRTMTEARLAQVIPVFGAGIGAGFNAYYTGSVCDAAFYLYRERFLVRKYGSEIIESAGGRLN